MLTQLLTLLVCPECQGELAHQGSTLVCQQCAQTYPIVDDIPRMLPNNPHQIASQVVEGFARQWQRYHQWRELYIKQFLGWIGPVQPDFFRGKLILDAGCGKGRHLRAASEFGAELVIGMDLGESVDVAWQANRERGNVACVQGDLFKPPFRPGTFDYAFSIGVLHHTPDPARAFASVLGLVKPGGHISSWVYGQENNAWLERIVAPVRNRITSKFSETALMRLSVALSLVLVAVTRGLYRPLSKLGRLPYQDYLLTLSEYPRQEIESIIFDHLHPVLNAYIPRAEVERWYAGLEEVGIRWHNRNSWSGFARIPPSLK